MLVVRRAEIDIAPSTLLGGPRHVPLVSLEHVMLVLETAQDGQRNWQLAHAFLDDPGGAGWPRQIRLSCATEATLLGQGNINFGAETIYVDITPHHKEVSAATLSTPVEVRGTYAGVTIRPAAPSIVERMSAAIAPAIRPPTPALQALTDIALGENNACTTAFGTQKAEDVAVGSSGPPKKSHP
jgi:hypothetical protein